jgi:pimeloyl-ACP methyl ester carboxylesterase
MLTRLLLLGALVAGVGAPTTHARVAQAGAFTKLDTKVTMSDSVEIAVTYYEPAGTPPAGGWPAVMMFHGLGQTRNSLDLNTWSANRVAETYLAPEGYAALTFDARAHGQSGGLFSLDGPRELQDTRELFAWLTGHSHVNGNKVGAVGVSYGGAMVWLATLAGVPFKAIAPTATWTDLREALAPQGLVRAGVVVGFSGDIPRQRYAPGLFELLQQALGGTNVAGVRAFLAERSVRSRLNGLETPTFMLQGRRDFAFDADQAISAFRFLKGPKRLYLGDLGHAPAANPAAEVPHFALEIRNWFDRFLKGVTNGVGNRAQVELAADPWSGKTVTYTGLPPTRTLRFSIGGRSTLGATGKIVRTTTPVRHVETFGALTVRVAVASSTGYAHLVAVVSAVRGDRTTVVSDGGIATPQLGRKPRMVTIRLPNEVTAIPRNARLRVTIGATSTVQSVANLVYLSPATAGSRATIGRVTLILPVLRKTISP